ncbi:MAG: hypothetical protein MJZ82_03240 [Paludibacteraceae bacterium]|nr:hypothetical protein [Paludibacteraceae bacterium]
MKKIVVLMAMLLSIPTLFAQEAHKPNWGAKDNAQFDYQNTNALELYGAVGYNFMSLADYNINPETGKKEFSRDLWINLGLNYMFNPYVKLGLDLIYNPETVLYNRIVSPTNAVYRNTMNLAFGPVAYYSPLDEFKPERKGKWFTLWLFAGLHVEYYRLNTKDIEAQAAAETDAVPWGMAAIVGLQTDFRITNYFKFFLKAAFDEQLALGLADPERYSGVSPKFFQVAINGGFAVSFPNMTKKGANDKGDGNGDAGDWMQKPDTVYVRDTVEKIIRDTVWISKEDFSDKEKVGSMTIDFGKNPSRMAAATNDEDECICDLEHPDLETVIDKMLNDETLTVALHGYAVLTATSNNGMESMKCARKIRTKLVNAGIASQRIYIYYCKDQVTENSKKALWVEADFYREKDKK